MDDEFGAILDRIVTDAKERSPVAIAGYFNAWAVEWGSKKTNWRGKSLLEAFAVLDLQLLNDGDVSTFIQGECTSMIDLIFTSSSLARGNFNWEVSDIITLSDHRAITWNTAGQLQQVQVSA
uniref:Endonuclease/exonuclease/phosphatase domain-containing protein n=1 Tax=Bracon brevicornis TaxID=1563983 RepID=A0A6V7JIC0_9HYME